MENVLRSRPKRSLVRRLAAPIASLALLTGGGWGAYHYYGSDMTGTAQPEEITVTAHSAAAAKDELKMLFASDEKSSNSRDQAKTAVQPKPDVPAKVDRYALSQRKPAAMGIAPPKLPPLVQQPTDAIQARPALGDRYATALTMAATAPVALSDTKPNTTEPNILTTSMSGNQSALLKSAKSDVARGQEPSNNPLRRTSVPISPPELDAKAAFGAALTQTPPTGSEQPAQPVSLPAEPKQPASSHSNELSAALRNARPLASSPLASRPLASNETPQALPSDRYRAAQTPPATPTTTPVQQRPQSPAPPLAIQAPRPRSTPPRQENPTPPRKSNLFATPPAELPTGHEPPAAPVKPDFARVPDYNRSAAQGLTPTPGLASHPGTGRPGERLLEGTQSPSITIQKLAPEQIQVGKRCTFAIRVQNSGQRTTQNVQIRDEVPLGTELIGTAPRANVSGGQIVWDLGTLSPGEQRTVEMELLPKEEGELGSVAVVSLSAQASAKSRCTRPELALRLTSKPQVHVGHQHVVQIEVSNPGSGDATSVMLLETIPAGVSHEAGPTLEFEIGTLRAGEIRRLELILTAEQAGQIHNVMTARADASLYVEADCEFEVIAPDLQVSVEGPQKRFLERPATYRVSIDNPGTASAREVQLVSHLPQGMQFVSANNMGEYDASSHSVHWSLAELPANERGTVELIALPVEAGAQTLQFATRAEQGLEDRTDKQVLVEGLSALMFEVIDVEGLIEIGKETTYEIRVQNQGSKAAANVQVVAIMPPGMRPITGQGETRHTIQGERVIFAPLPQLAPKSESTFRIQAQGIRAGDQRVRVQITDDDMLQPITKEVNTRVYADE